VWGGKYPGIIRLCESAWAEFVPFLAFELEVRRVIFSTNAIESLNARFRRAVRARGHFPNEQAATKCLYLALRSLDPQAADGNDGPCAGSQHSTPSPSCSKAESSPTTNDRARPGYTENPTVPRCPASADRRVRVWPLGQCACSVVVAVA
jgi:hypothetical protein